MNRLFMLRDVRTNKPFIGIPKELGPLSFRTKIEAKTRRDEIKATGAYELKVSPGPDHRNHRP
jgi:hypothetical protein